MLEKTLRVIFGKVFGDFCWGSCFVYSDVTISVPGAEFTHFGKNYWIRIKSPGSTNMARKWPLWLSRCMKPDLNMVTKNFRYLKWRY